MKYVKMLGLAAVAAAALMAFVGASSASATVLCKTEGIKNGGVTGTTCPEGWAYGKGTEIHAVSEGVVKLTTTFLNIECEESTIRGSTSNEGSATETVNVNVESFTLGKCNCVFKVLKSGELEIHWIEGTHNGTLTSKNTETTMSCETIFGSIHCIYATGSGVDLGTLTGSTTTGGTATLDAEKANIPRLTTNSLCANEAGWDARYKVTTPDFLDVAGHT